jgi:hypothetical protein
MGKLHCAIRNLEEHSELIEDELPAKISHMLNNDSQIQQALNAAAAMHNLDQCLMDIERVLNTHNERLWQVKLPLQQHPRVQSHLPNHNMSTLESEVKLIEQKL